MRFGVVHVFMVNRQYCYYSLFFFQGIGCTFNQLGNAGGFFFGPWLVHLPGNHSKPDNTTSDTDVEDLRRAIYDYMWISKL